MTLFGEIAFVVVVAVLAGFVAHVLRQPVIIGFIAGGFLIGIFKYTELANVGLIGDLASIGVALLLFLVGLEMNLKELRNVTVPAFFVGLGQILFTFGIGFFVVSALGFSLISSFYIAIALTFSSTIIVVKLLSEKKSLSSLYGRIVIGILLVQDFVAILVLIFIAGLQGDGGVGAHLAVTFLKGAGLVLFTIVAYRLLPKLLDVIGRSQEMLYLFAIAWALGISALAASIGLSVEVGGFLAGLALASSSEHFQIAARLRPLRDFFIILFFVGLGIQALEGGGAIPLVPVIVLSLFVLIGNPFIVLTLMGMLGYRARTSFLSSLTVAQISEFSFIIVALGFRFGDLTSSEVSLVTLVGMFTIFVSSYFIVHGDRLYAVFRPIVKKFEFRKHLVDEIPPEVEMSGHVVLIGVHRMGESILRALSNAGIDFVALDFDPVVVKRLSGMGIPVVYGDITDIDIQERVGMQNARLVISTIPGFGDNAAVVKILKGGDSDVKVIVTADDGWHARELYRDGADYVLVPHFIGGQELANVIREDNSLENLRELKKRDLEALSRT